MLDSMRVLEYDGGMDVAALQPAIVKIGQSGVHTIALNTITMALIASLLLVVSIVFFFWCCHRKAQRTLEESDRHYRELFEDNPCAMLVYDIDSLQILAANDAALSQYGYSREEFLSLTVLELVPAENVLPLLQVIHGANPALNQSGLWRQRCKSGELIDVEVVSHGVRFNGHAARLVLLTDVTRRLRAEQENRRFRTALDYSSDAIFLIDPETFGFIDVNATACNRLGYSSDELVHMGPGDISVDFDMAKARALYRKLLASQNGADTVNACHRRKDGSVFPVEIGVRVMPCEDKPLIVSIARDISEKVRVEQMLQESEQLNLSILNSATDGFFVVDKQGHFLEINPAFCRLVGYTHEQLLEMSLHDIEVDGQGGKSYTVPTPQSLSLPFSEAIYRRKNGTLMTVEVSVNHLVGNGKYFSFVRDLTERKQAEQKRLQLAEEQRNTLIREVHHRIKNNLQGVVGLLSLYVIQHPEAASAIDNVIGKIMSVAVVFGLQGQRDENDTRLCEITAEICKSAEELTHTKVETLVEVDWARPIKIDKDKAVPIALIVNELVTNALKHGQGGEQQEPIHVCISTDGKSAILRIQNKCLVLPSGFDFDLGTGIGTGLTLVRSMLPREGARLSLTLDDGIMTAELRLEPPIISIPKN